MDQFHPSRREMLLTLGSMFAARSRAQDDVTFRTGVKVVNVLATVRMKNGPIVRDLNKEDFSVFENARQQTIQYFARESDLPLTLGLMVDTSVSQERVIAAERAASLRFFDRVLRPDKDQVFVTQFDMGIYVRQPLTASLKLLDDALEAVDTPTRRELAAQVGGGTLLFDAVVKVSNEIMQARTGRKALIVLSDGVDVGSENTLAAAIEAAQRADTLIYSILFSDATYYRVPLIGNLGDQGRSALMRMSKETGGGYFEVSKKVSLDNIFDILQEELRSQYSLGYVSDQPVRISEWRKIQLAVSRKSVVIQARDRYWAKR